MFALTTTKLFIGSLRASRAIKNAKLQFLTESNRKIEKLDIQQISYTLEMTAD